MVTKDKYEQNVVDLVKQLDCDWFKKKEELFKKEQYYNKEKDEIYREEKEMSHDYSYDDQGKQYIEDYIDCSKTIRLDFKQYCSLHSPIDATNNWGVFEHSKGHRTRHDRIYLGIPEEILDELKNLLTNVSDPLAVSKVIYNTIDIIYTTVDANGQKNDCLKLYYEALQYFKEYTSSFLLKRFSNILTVKDIAIEYQDKLEFNLRQEELAALLYVLNKAKFLNTDDYLDNRFLAFCFNYFRFRKKEEYVRIKSLESFKEKYREIVRGDSQKSLLNVKTELLSALKQV